MAGDVATWRAAVTLSLTERCVSEAAPEDVPALDAPPPAAEAPEEESAESEPPPPPLPPPPLRFAPPTPEALAAADAPAPRAKARRVPPAAGVSFRL